MLSPRCAGWSGLSRLRQHFIALIIFSAEVTLLRTVNLSSRQIARCLPCGRRLLVSRKIIWLVAAIGDEGPLSSDGSFAVHSLFAREQGEAI